MKRVPVVPMQCEVAREDAGPRTYEIRLQCPTADQPLLLAGLHRYGKNRIVDHGLVNFAIVIGFGETVYFVVTDGHVNSNAYRDWKNRMKTVTCLNLQKLPVVAQVEYVRPFTKFSQRRFGWGDVEATTEEVVVAVQEESYAELVAIMPEAKPLIQSGELQQLPALFGAMRSGLPIALADCTHQFLTERMCAPSVLGPCGACGKAESDEYKQGFTRCGKCDSVRCKQCANDITTQQDQQQSLLQTYHEVTAVHTWTESKDECNVCGAGPCDCGSKHCDECRAGVQTMQCSCGVVRCTECLHVHAWGDPAVDVDAAAGPSTEAAAGGQLAQNPSSKPQPAVCTLSGSAPSKVCNCGEARCESCFVLDGGSRVETRYEVHPSHQPAKFYVTHGQMEDTVKLEWLAHQLGDDADLLVFARMYHKLFGEQGGVAAQKGKCLKLYRQYANIAKRSDLGRGPYSTVAEARKKLYSMECQVPPDELEEFQQIWDADAPRRCYETNSELPAGTPLGQHFCSPEHAHAGKQIFCTSVTKRTVVNGEEIVDRCNGKVAYRSACLVCTSCGQGANVAKSVAQIQERAADTELGKSLKRSAESLRIANNVWGKFDSQTDPNYVPAWTKRKRL